MIKKFALALLCCAVLTACQTVREINPRETLDAFAEPFNVVKLAGDVLAKGDIPHFDTNKDGVLDIAEFTTVMMGKSKYRLRAAEADMTTERYIAADFKAIDQNADGFISQSEYQAFRDWHHENTRRRFVEREI